MGLLTPFSTKCGVSCPYPLPLSTATPILLPHLCDCANLAASSTSEPRWPRVALAVLPRRPCCHVVRTALPTLLPHRPQCLAVHESRRQCCHACLAASRSALPRWTCCLTDHSASPSTSCTGSVAMPAPLPRGPHCHVGPAAASALLSFDDCCVSCRPCCQAIRSAALTVPPHGLRRRISCAASWDCSVVGSGGFGEWTFGILGDCCFSF
jgi:hypothetical protein